MTNEVGEIQGYVKLHRKLLDSRVFKHDGLCRTWIWCLLKATHRQRWVTISTGKGSTEVLLQPGQFIFGRESAARELGVPPSTIRNWIEKLKNLENLDIKQDRQYSIISIRNWHTYQAQDDELGQPIGQQKDSQRTAKGHKQECKECKECKEKDLCPEPKNALDPPRASEPIFCQIPVKPNGTQFNIPVSKIKEWEQAFDGLDVKRCVRMARQWCVDNPARRKTARGVYKFLNTWLTKENDRGHNISGKAKEEPWNTLPETPPC